MSWARKYLPLAAVLLSLLTGCAQQAPEENAVSIPGKNSAGRDDPKNEAAKPKPEESGPGTVKDEFMPAVERAHEGVTWPPAYTMTPDRIWEFLAPGAADTTYSEADAVSMVQIWNTCAWTLQLVDDTKAGRPVDGAVAALGELDGGDSREVIGRIVSDAKLGELATANQFVTANDCAKGFQR